jgi:PTH2 family peptidyl-tRNA hydrolase
MPSGKMSAQAGHAYCDSLEFSRINYPELFSTYRLDGIGGSKVTLKSKNMNYLLNAYEKCLENSIPARLIVDQEHIMLPHFTGEPIITALGIGPCKKSDVKIITKKFQCL